MRVTDAKGRKLPHTSQHQTICIYIWKLTFVIVVSGISYISHYYILSWIIVLDVQSTSDNHTPSSITKCMYVLILLYSGPFLNYNSSLPHDTTTSSFSLSLLFSSQLIETRTYSIPEFRSNRKLFLFLLVQGR